MKLTATQITLTFAIDDSAHLVPEGDSRNHDGQEPMIRPTVGEVTITIPDKTITHLRLRGPRQARPTDSWTGDSRDSGTADYDLTDALNPGIPRPYLLPILDMLAAALTLA